MADGLTSIGSLSKRDVRTMAVETAEKLELACSPLPIPELPFGGGDGPATDEPEIIAAWNALRVRRSQAIADNERRLTGCLWCYRALRHCYEADRSDTQLLFLGRRVRDFLAKHWGLTEPPLERVEAYAAAQRRAWEMAR